VVVVAADNSDTPLTDAEIAGIVCACLIFVACVAIAAIYYWFCRNTPSQTAKVSIIFKDWMFENRKII